MKGLDFPMVKTKGKDSSVYDINDRAERKKYFESKVGKEIDALKKYMESSTFVSYLLGKKQAGKGTYTKLLAEIFGTDKIKHLSVGDLVRSTDSINNDPAAKQELRTYMENNYRGFMPIDDAFEAFTNRSTKALLPTEFVLALVKREIEKAGKTNLFIDGFPRDMDQISYSLYFRELINYRNDPDIFVLIDVPEAVIDERIKSRRICPKCLSSRNLRLFPTKNAGYDKETKEFYLICDNPECEPVKLVGKEGDDLGIETIRDRIEMDDNLIRKAFSLHGVPKILLRNSMPKEIANEMVDPYEITKIKIYNWDGEKVQTEDQDWTFKDDNGIESYSLVAPAVTVDFIKQLYSVLIK